MKKDFSNLVYDDYLSNEAKDFLESVKTHKYHLNQPGYAQNIMVVNSTKYFQDKIQGQAFTVGSPENTIPLTPHIKHTEEAQTFKAIQERRKSTRQYSGTGLSLSKIASFLDLVYFKKAGSQGISRNIASGGGLFPVECYYIHMKKSDLDIGVYHYNLHHRSLFKVRDLEEEAMKENIDNIFFTDYKVDIDVNSASGVLVFVGNVNKAAFKYDDKAIKWSYYDTGALLALSYLSAELNGIACCACGGYLDEDLDQFLGLTYYQQTAQSVVFIGENAES